MKTVKRLLVGLIVIVIYLGSVFLGGRVFAQETEETGKIEYSLAYPGILPDSPVYFLKVARDQVMLWLARDPQQKAFYLLLLSDKRLASGQMLIEKGKNSVGAAAVVKGEEYFSRAVDTAIQVKESGEDTNDLFAKLTVSSAKHTEVIGTILGKVSGKDAELLAKARRDNQTSSQRVREIFFQMVGLAK